MYRILQKGYWFAAAWTVLIFVLLAMPGKDVPSIHFLNRIHFDKFVHFCLFGGFVGLWTIPYASRKDRNTNTRIFWVVFLTACLFGYGMELFQRYLATDRDYEVGDIIADCTGAMVGMVISMSWVRAMRARGSRPHR